MSGCFQKGLLKFNENNILDSMNACSSIIVLLQELQISFVIGLAVKPSSLRSNVKASNPCPYFDFFFKIDAIEKNFRKK